MLGLGPPGAPHGPPRAQQGHPGPKRVHLGGRASGAVPRGGAIYTSIWMLMQSLQSLEWQQAPLGPPLEWNSWTLLHIGALLHIAVEGTN